MDDRQACYLPVGKVVNGHGFPFNQVPVFEQQDKFSENLPECFGIVFTEIGDGLKLRLESFYEPDGLQVGLLKSPTVAG